jgi:hypothetical protein
MMDCHWDRPYLTYVFLQAVHDLLDLSRVVKHLALETKHRDGSSMHVHAGPCSTRCMPHHLSVNQPGHARLYRHASRLTEEEIHAYTCHASASMMTVCSARTTARDALSTQVSGACTSHHTLWVVRRHFLGTVLGSIEGEQPGI